MKLLLNILVVSGALFIAFLVAEIASRYVMPISPGAQSLDLEGNPIKGLDAEYFHLKPNIEYRQVFNEFDAKTTIDKFGNRKIGSSVNPQILFVGDSFTFGHGLADEETFPLIYCKKLGLTCANLGRSGVGTAKEMEILDYFLVTKGWRPKIVKLFLLAMSGTMMSGNDIYDNYLRMKEEQNKSSAFASGTISPESKKPKTEGPGFLRSTVKLLKNNILVYSNLGRLFYFTLGHRIRSLLSPPTSKSVLEEGLIATKVHLERFKKLSVAFGFETEIYVIHPVQDVLRGTSKETIQTLETSIPGHLFISTAEAFSNDPRQYYYAYDGHLNANGAEKLAYFLLEQKN
jgi:hypothetical protein